VITGLGKVSLVLNKKGRKEIRFPFYIATVTLLASFVIERLRRSTEPAMTATLDRAITTTTLRPSGTGPIEYGTIPQRFGLVSLAGDGGQD